MILSQNWTGRNCSGKFGEVAGNGLDIRYGKKRDRTNETREIGRTWQSGPGLRIAPWTQHEKKRENMTLLFMPYSPH
jgi:hypothetical protein